MWDPQCHLNERVSVARSSRGSNPSADYKIHVGLNVIETLLGTDEESGWDGKSTRHWKINNLDQQLTWEMPRGL